MFTFFLIILSSVIAYIFNKISANEEVAVENAAEAKGQEGDNFVG